MDSIKNYKLKYFLRKPPSLVEEYVDYLRYLDPIQTKKKVFNMKLKHVEFIKRNINLGDTESIIKIVSKVQGISIRQVLNIRIITFFRLVNSIKKQIKIINESEEKALTSDHVNVKWEIINGSKRVAKFGIYNVLRNLSNKDITKHKKIRNTRYNEIFITLYMDRFYGDLETEMNKIKSDTNV